MCEAVGDITVREHDDHATDIDIHMPGSTLCMSTCIYVLYNTHYTIILCV